MEIKKTCIIFFCLTSLAFGVTSDMEWGGNISLTGEDFTEGTRKELRFYDGVNYVGFEAGALSANQIWVLPLVDAVSGGQALLSDAAGVLSWGTPTTAAAHSILGGTHDDAATDAVTRGSIIIGNATPEWDELVIGANQTVFVSDGTDPSWGTVDISGGTNLAVNTDHLKLTGDTVDLADNQDINLHNRQGSFLEQLDFTISESGGTVTGSLEKEGTGDLAMFFSDEYTTLDCTPAATVNLTSLVGTDTAPAAAFVYVPQSTKTLTAAASWPSAATEHIRVASVVLQSAATTGTNGALMIRNWNDEAFGITDPRGHDLHTAERLRFEHALWSTGVVLTITGSGTATITLDTTAGTVYQLHLQTFPAIDMAGADDIHLVNLSGSEYSTTSNLVAGITTLADGVTALANNKYFNIVIWGVQNRSGTTSHLMCNLSTGQYNTSLAATTDSSKFSVHTIPSAFRGTGFLIAELTFQLTGGGTTWTLVQNKDLLGQIPTLVPGGGTTTAVSIFSDSSFELFDNGDDTKEGVFELSGITTGNKRTLTWTDVSTKIWADDGSVPLTANWDVGAFDIRAATGTFDSLTSGRVPFASTNGLLVDDADMTFATDTLTVTKLASDSWKSNDASMTTDYTTTAAGSLVLDGDGDSVVATGYKGITSTNARSCAAWIKTAIADRVIMEWGADVAGQKWTFKVSATNLLRIEVNGGATHGTTAIQDDTWRHVVVTWTNDGTPDVEDAILYVNGSEDSTVNISTETINTASSEDVRIGDSALIAARDWDGGISDVMIFNDDLSAAEVSALHALGQNPTEAQVAALAPVVAGDLVSWWPFTTNADDAESSNDGTLVDNAYINSTAIVGLTASESVLVNGNITSSGALNVNGTGRVVGIFAVTNIQSTGDLTLNPASGENLKSAGLATSGSGANVFYSSSVDTFFRSTSSPWLKIILSDMSAEKASSVLNLTPIKFHSKCKGDNPDKVFYGLSAVDVAEKFPEAAFYDANSMPNGWDTNMMIAALIKNQQGLDAKDKVKDIAIQTLQEQNADFERRLKELEK